MRRLLRLKAGAPGRLVRRLDRIAGEINPFLAVVAIGLVMLNLCCFVALTVVRLLPAASPAMEIIARH